MSFRFPTARLSIALLAQVVFCLVAAPVIAAQQWAALPVPCGEDPKKAPADSRATILAAIDASNVRPEEVSDAEQKKGKSHSRCKRASVGSALADALRSSAVGRAVSRASRPCLLSKNTGETPVIREKFPRSNSDASSQSAVSERVRLGGPYDGSVVTRASRPCVRPRPSSFSQSQTSDTLRISHGRNAHVTTTTAGDCPLLCETCVESALLRPLHKHVPAVQPTGPPIC